MKRLIAAVSRFWRSRGGEATLLRRDARQVGVDERGLRRETRVPVVELRGQRERALRLLPLQLRDEEVLPVIVDGPVGNEKHPLGHRPPQPPRQRRGKRRVRLDAPDVGAQPLDVGGLDASETVAQALGPHPRRALREDDHHHDDGGDRAQTSSAGAAP